MAADSCERIGSLGEYEERAKDGIPGTPTFRRQVKEVLKRPNEQKW